MDDHCRNAGECIRCRQNNSLRFGDIPLDQLPLTMAYVPMQQYTESYDPEKALCAGTLFPELDKPFCGRGVCNER